MDTDRMSKRDDGAAQTEPRRLHKPRRALGDLGLEQVLTYLDEGPCTDSTSTSGPDPEIPDGPLLGSRNLLTPGT